MSTDALTFVLCGLTLGSVIVAWATRPLWQGRALAAHALPLPCLLLGMAALGYVAWGAPQQVAVGPQPALLPTVALVERPGAVRIAAMVDGLRARLAARPDDAEGWLMLARSETVLGRPAAAVEALRRASALRPTDADLLVDLAFTIATQNGRRLDGEPATMVARALQLAPDSRKVLALAGAVAYDRNDFTAAVAHWERLAALEGPGSAQAASVRESIDDAKRQALARRP
ncbi:MAG: tetratricopeptide repeat protein [Pseudomonadota bacterium]